MTAMTGRTARGTTWVDVATDAGLPVDTTDACDSCWSHRDLYRLLGRSTALCAPCFAAAHEPGPEHGAQEAVLVRRPRPHRALSGIRRPQAAGGCPRSRPVLAPGPRGRRG